MTSLPWPATLPGEPSLDRVGRYALLGAVASTQVSIAAAQGLLAVAAVCWLAQGGRVRLLDAPFFFWPLLGYATWTLVAAGFSPDPAASLSDSRQLLLFLLVPVVYQLARAGHARTMLSVVITVGALSALVGLVQYAILNYDAGRRLQGTLSHWMTYSGTLMLVICAAVGRVLHDTRDRTWAALVIPALVASLLLSFTRSAMVGAAAGIGTLLLLRDLRMVGLLPIAAAIVLALSPAALSDRIYSTFDITDPTSRDRVAMLHAGVAMVGDHVMTGVGPEMVGRVYPRYRVATAVQANNMHLHNVPMQIAAERGLPALALWLWFVGAVLYGLRPLLARPDTRALAAVALAAVAATLTAGLFEYNFGDSEFLMLLLVLVTLPFAAARQDEVGPDTTGQDKVARGGTA